MSDDLVATLHQAGHDYTDKAADLIKAQADRIAELEAALRNIEDEATALQARVAKLKRLVEILMENDPDDMAADAVTVLDVWRKEASAALEGWK
jgi:ABC-type transporter Mla subunit MlaD